MTVLRGSQEFHRKFKAINYTNLDVLLPNIIITIIIPISLKIREDPPNKKNNKTIPIISTFMNPALSYRSQIFTIFLQLICKFLEP